MPNISFTIRLSAAILFAACLLMPGPARADDFPEGPGREELMKVCTTCHDLDAVLHLSYSKKEWQGLVYAMQDNGADATPVEVEAIVNYLAKNFGKEPAKINVNKATASEIEQGLSVTTKEAAAIVDYRTKNGDFKTIDDLKKVDGVDAKKLDAAKDRVAF